MRMQEAQAWLGGGSAVLGRAHQLGPHPYVTVNLFPSDDRLARRLPPLRTPFQVSDNASAKSKWVLVNLKTQASSDKAPQPWVCCDNAVCVCYVHYGIHPISLSTMETRTCSY
jgi:hypothetical protein